MKNDWDLDSTNGEDIDGQNYDGQVIAWSVIFVRLSHAGKINEESGDDGQKTPSDSSPKALFSVVVRPINCLNGNMIYRCESILSFIYL